MSGQRIYFLMFNADGLGGVARTVRNLVSHLSKRHHVEIISLYRKRDTPSYAISPDVKVTYLIDRREGAPDHADAMASDLELTKATDAHLAETFNAREPGILVSTRPSLHAAVARIAPHHLITIGQDHLNFKTRSADARVLEMLQESIQRLDCYVVLTKGDVEDYARLVAPASTLITAIPNAIPWPVATTAAQLTSKIVIGAGRLVAQKGFSRLIEAYAPIARAHPDWQLHIYGKGQERRQLAALIGEQGIADQVVLQGHSSEFEEVLANASIYAMSSVFEGFPMVLIEAMSKGVPLVSFDCPRGPAEIIVDGENGRLVPDGDIPAFTRALVDLIEDPALRARVGAAGLAAARQLEIDNIAARWETLFEQLVATRRAAELAP